MDKEQAFAMIEQAKVRLLTAEECDELGEWAAVAKTEASAPGDVNFASNPLVEWITKFTKETRSSEYFTPNFKKVNKTVMPHVVAVFEKTTHDELAKCKDGKERDYVRTNGNNGRKPSHMP